MADKSESGGGSDDPVFPCEDPNQPELEDWYLVEVHTQSTVYNNTPDALVTTHPTHLLHTPGRPQ